MTEASDSDIKIISEAIVTISDPLDRPDEKEKEEKRKKREDDEDEEDEEDGGREGLKR